VHVIVDLREQLALVVRLIDPVAGPGEKGPVVEDAEQAVRVRAGWRELRIVVDVGGTAEGLLFVRNGPAYRSLPAGRTDKLERGRCRTTPFSDGPPARVPQLRSIS
jgi:hypothetical protein